MALIFERAPICPECRRAVGNKLGRVGATGRRVRCTGFDCGHVWTIYAIAEEYRDNNGIVRARSL
jgi:hypothetical protein